MGSGRATVPHLAKTKCGKCNFVSKYEIDSGGLAVLREASRGDFMTVQLRRRSSNVSEVTRGQSRKESGALIGLGVEVAKYKDRGAGVKGGHLKETRNSGLIGRMPRYVPVASSSLTIIDKAVDRELAIASEEDYV